MVHGPNLAHSCFYTTHYLSIIFTFLNGKKKKKKKTQRRKKMCGIQDLHEIQISMSCMMLDWDRAPLPIIYTFSVADFQIQMQSVWDRIYGSQRLKYLLSDPLHRRLANFCCRRPINQGNRCSKVARVFLPFFL